MNKRGLAEEVVDVIIKYLYPQEISECRRQAIINSVVTILNREEREEEWKVI